MTRLAAFTVTRSAQQAPESERAEDWRAQAACAGLATRAYDPWYREWHGLDEYSDARRICAGCPVTEACLADVMADEGSAGREGRYGIRAGLTPEQRARLHRDPEHARAISQAAQDRAERYQQIRSMREDGMTLRAIRTTLGVSEGMVTRALRGGR